MKLKIFFVIFLVIIGFGFLPTISNAALPTGCFIEEVSDVDCDGVVDNKDNCPVDRNGACECPSIENGLCVYANTTVEYQNAKKCSLDGDNKVSEKEFLAGNQANWNFMEPGDGGGDACDDYDSDGIVDWKDNCKLIPNEDQKDKSRSGIGDACEDTDKDGILDYHEYLDSESVTQIERDNCVQVWNPRQEDRDLDGKGDACDPCPLDGEDLCTDDKDKDGIVDWMDNCENRYNPGQEDRDVDNIGDVCDNCPDVLNPDQTDTNENEIGDACEIIKSVDPVNPDSEKLQGGGGCNLNSSASLFGMFMLIPVFLLRKKR